MVWLRKAADVLGVQVTNTRVKTSLASAIDRPCVQLQADRVVTRHVHAKTAAANAAEEAESKWSIHFVVEPKKNAFISRISFFSIVKVKG